jgi:hypothetical protein
MVAYIPDRSSESTTTTGLLDKSIARFSFISHGSFITMLFNAATRVTTIPFSYIFQQTRCRHPTCRSLSSPSCYLSKTLSFVNIPQDYHVLPPSTIAMVYYITTPCAKYITLHIPFLLPALRGQFSIKRTAPFAKYSTLIRP